MKRVSSATRGLSALVLLLGLLWSSAGVASAAPTAEFTFLPATPVVSQPVTFTFTGTCDVAPCRIQWKWFKDGGSHLGTSMGEGAEISYAFDESGSYSVVAKITNATTTHGSATAMHGVNVRAIYQDDDRAIAYNGWRGVSDATASGGGYRVASTDSPRATFTFSGTRVRYFARTGPAKGIATMMVDGVSYGSLDLYTKTPTTRSKLVSGLIDGPHRVVVKAAGTKNPLSTGTAVTVDGFAVGTTRYDDDDPSVAYNGWTGRQDANADGGGSRSNAATGSSTQLAFNGTTVTWLTATGPAQGIAAITIDGNSQGTVDNYANTRTWRVARTFVGLTSGLHTIKVVVLGAHNSSSISNRIVSDAFIVR